MREPCPPKMADTKCGCLEEQEFWVSDVKQSIFVSTGT